MTTHDLRSLNTRPDVLVIGAGPTGLTAAAEARRHGLSVRIIDKTDARTPFSKALVVHSRTLELFSDMGLVSRVLARGREFRALNLYAGYKPMARIVFSELDWQNAAYPCWLCIPQSDTELCLAEHLSDLDVTIERRTELVEFVPHSDRVVAKLQREDGQIETCEAAWMVACDGARSQVRKSLGINFEGASGDEIFILADMKMESAMNDAEGYNFMSRDGVMFVVPMPKPGQVRMICHMPALTVQDQPVISLELLQSLLDQRSGQKTRLFDLGWTSHFSTRHFVAQHYRQGRIFLAGDASHVHSPVGGQGLNMGIQDAYNLMWKLALYHKGLASAALLDSYEAERHTIAAAAIRNVRLATRLLTVRNSIAQELRNQLARVLMGTGTVKNRLGRDVGMLNASYEDSPVVAEDLPLAGSLATLVEKFSATAAAEFKRSPSAGELAPNVDGAGGSPGRFLDALRGPHHTLLLFVGLDGSGQVAAWSSAVAQLRQRYDAAVVMILVHKDAVDSPLGCFEVMLRDAEGKLHRRYGAQAACLYLIRPDKYIAYRCQPVDFGHLLAYLDRVLVPRTS